MRTVAMFCGASAAAILCLACSGDDGARETATDTGVIVECHETNNETVILDVECMIQG